MTSDNGFGREEFEELYVEDYFYIPSFNLKYYQ